MTDFRIIQPRDDYPGLTCYRLGADREVCACGTGETAERAVMERVEEVRDDG